jgi:hypothetical protein
VAEGLERDHGSIWRVSQYRLKRLWAAG